MSQIFKITVPATTANIGPGYDSLGIALNLFNIYTAQSLPDSKDKIIEFEDPSWKIPLKENYVVNALEFAIKTAGLDIKGYKIKTIQMDIPVSRGLGSSAAAYVAGLMIANALSGGKLSPDLMIEMGTALEGHPDNIAPAILGNMTTSVQVENKVFSSIVKIPESISFITCIPNFRLSTKVMRDTLPQTLSYKEAIFNISRAALLMASLNKGELDHLKVALDDCLHQPYRIKHIEYGESIFSHARSLNSLGSFISGAGPTIISLASKENKTFLDRLENRIRKDTSQWQIMELSVNPTGATLEVI